LRSSFCGHYGSNSSRRSTRAACCAASPRCSARRSRSSTCCWQASTRPQAVGYDNSRVGAPEAFAPASGYLAFFTLALYVGGLILLAFSPAEVMPDEQPARAVLESYQQLAPAERTNVRVALARMEAKQIAAEVQTEEQLATAEASEDEELKLKS
jgi:hypothetical protein